MAYLGHQPTTGASKSFRLLDDIKTYTLTFDGSSAGTVSVANDTISNTDHRFIQGQRVTYNNGGGGNIGGLTSGTAYYVIKNDKNTIKLATDANTAANGTAINITAVGTGSSHTLNIAFDGVNTKFVASYSDGTKVHMTRAGQLYLSMNGVIQQPHDTATPSTGFGHDVESIIVMSQAPAATDAFWGHVISDNVVTHDVTDHKLDTFTGNGSTNTFTLSKTVVSNENILVTIDGVIQYPSEGSTTRAYSVVENVITFAAAPALNAAIQVRHIGFAGSSTTALTAFYGRSGNVTLVTSDHITVGNVNSSGVITATSFKGDGSSLTGIAATDYVVSNTLKVLGVSTFVGNAQFDGDVSIGGTLTYEDVTNIDSVGIITARAGINVTGGTGTFAGNINANGNIVGDNSTNVSGISSVTATSFHGDGSKLTGVAGGKFRGYTAGIGTETSVGVNTTNLDNSALTGVGNSFQGMYISNGMMIVDNHLEGNHYIGTAYNGLMAGPVTVNGVLTVDGNYVVV